MKRLVSGIKPTGTIHVGNYLGMMKQTLDMYDKYESFLFIADYHALNQVHDAIQLKGHILEIAKSYLAIGLDPNKCVLFRQSDVPFHTELCWVLNSIAPMGLLKRAHAFKDAEAKGEQVNVGLFDYPVLMAADIILYDAQIVPVGSDQKQHVEIAQELARIFNNTFGETFEVPQVMIKDEVATIKGLDGRKMSKSYNNIIGLFDEKNVIAKKVMSIVTDSKAPTDPKNPEECNVFYYHKLFNTKNLTEIKNRYLEGTISYKESKELLVDSVDAFLAPLRDKKKELDQNPDYVLDVLKSGKQKAFAVAEKKMLQVRERIGVTL